MTLFEILSDIHSIDNALAEFEQDYGLLSSTFFAWFQQGNEPEEQSWVLDFAEWSGLYRSKQRLLAQLSILSSPQSPVQSPESGLAALRSTDS